MKKVAEARMASGRGSTQDALQAEVELGHLEHDRVMLETERIMVSAHINGLLHRPCYPWTPTRTMVDLLRARMRNHRIHRCILAPIAVLMLLVVGFRSTYAMYRCAGDGVARTACCCPQDENAKDEAADREIAIKAACCCDIELAQAIASVDVRLDGPSSHEIAALPVLQDDWVVTTIRPSQTSPEPAYVHRSSGPPLRLVKQSFLI